MAAIRAAENVDYPMRIKLYDLYADILTDAHLASVIMKRKSKLISVPVEFRRNGKPDETVNMHLKSPWFYRFIGDAFDSELWGMSMMQFSKTKDGWITYNLVPRKHIDPLRQVILRRQGDINGTPWSEFYNLLFVESQNQIGILASAAYYIIYKRNTMGDWAQFSEIFGMPIREYTYEDTDEDTRKRLTDDAYNQGGGSVYVHPKNSELKFIESSNKTGSSDLYDKLVDRCNAEISKLILGNTLTTEAGKNGTQSLGTVQQKSEDALQYSDRLFILNLLNYEMSDIFMDMGIDTKGGEFVYLEQEDKDIMKQLAVFQGLFNMGLPIGQDDVYEAFGIKKPTGEIIHNEPPKMVPVEPKEGDSSEGSTSGGSDEEPDEEPVVSNKENQTFFNKLKSFFVEAPQRRGALKW
ncbi:MAG: DUF935 domain-containing protein [Bacteroidales bacterium]|nr:DUF935 domain-containing protein [Bacteroidales bacterium]